MEGVLAGRSQIVFMRHANASSVEFQVPNLSQPSTGGGAAKPAAPDSDLCFDGRLGQEIHT